MSGHPRTHQNATLRTYAGLLLISFASIRCVCSATHVQLGEQGFRCGQRLHGAARQRVHAVARRLASLRGERSPYACGVPFWGLPSCRYKRRGDLVCPVLSCPSRHPRFTGVAGSGGAHSRHVRHCRHVPPPGSQPCACGLCDLQSCRFAVRSNYRRLGCADVRGGVPRSPLSVFSFSLSSSSSEAFRKCATPVRASTAHVNTSPFSRAGGSPVSFSPKPAVSLSSPPSATLSLSVWRNSAGPLRGAHRTHVFRVFRRPCRFVVPCAAHARV